MERDLALRQGFSRLQTFLWFATAATGFTVRTELLGVTSIVRALKLDARYYNPLGLLSQFRPEGRPTLYFVGDAYYATGKLSAA